MVKKINTNLEEIQKLFTKLKIKTNNFQELNEEILMENSKYILIFRLILEMSSENFAKLCNRTQGSIYNLEREERKIDSNTAKYYSKIITKQLKNPRNISLDAVKLVYEKFYSRYLRGIACLSKESRVHFAKKGSKIALEKRKKDVTLGTINLLTEICDNYFFDENLEEFIKFVKN